MSETIAPIRRVSTVTKDDPLLPGPPIEIHIWADPQLEQFTVDPRGLLSVAEVQAISVRLRRGGGETDQLVDVIAILVGFGWQLTEQWLAEGQHLHAKLQRPVRLDA